MRRFEYPEKTIAYTAREIIYEHAYSMGLNHEPDDPEVLTSKANFVVGNIVHWMRDDNMYVRDEETGNSFTFMILRPTEDIITVDFVRLYQERYDAGVREREKRLKEQRRQNPKHLIDRIRAVFFGS